MTDSQTQDPIFDMYIYETTGQLERLENIILECDKHSRFSIEAIHEIFRIMHTIKGSSTMMHYDNIAALAHATEDLFSWIRKQETEVEGNRSQVLSDLLLEGVDFTKVELHKIKNGVDAGGDAEPLIGHVRDCLDRFEHPTADDAASCPESNLCRYEAVVSLEDEGGMENIRAYLIVQQLQLVCPAVLSEPADLTGDESAAARIREQGLRLRMASAASLEALHQAFSGMSGIKDVQLLPAREDNPVSSPVAADNDLTSAEKETEKADQKRCGRVSSGGQATAAAASSASNYISVHVAKLDELMDLVGELVIAETMVTHNPDLDGLELGRFQKASSHLGKISHELQDKVMSIRLVPLHATFRKMERIVRDMTRKLGKEIRLELIGEETEVDKKVIEHISDPLMHLVRNAIDHGIESGEARLAAGKPKAGTITLGANHTGNEVQIFVRDDGKGLDKHKIWRKAQENGLVRGETEMTDRDVYNLIFMPGFSTKETITEYSGRGVGMDVVTRSLEAVGGTVSVHSNLGEGTTMTFKLPLSLSIIDGMNFRVGATRFTLSTTSIKESFKARKEDLLQDPDGREMILVRGQCYPVLRLHKHYGIASDVRRIEDGILMMIEQEGRMLCLLADELLGQQQVVVKALPVYLRKMGNADSLMGCSLLGDGSVSLILDGAGLLRARSHNEAHASEASVVRS
ncbi:chemotaxis protein CheW [Paenibacillus macerans]|uniref:chemotaxis protein CheW n=1 Tax=Paenibacillus macerans TaxID=44252 RepID=UPI003D311A6E